LKKKVNEGPEDIETCPTEVANRPTIRKRELLARVRIGRGQSAKSQEAFKLSNISVDHEGSEGTRGKTR